MDMSFGLQSLMSEYIVKSKDKLKPGMVDVPVEIDDRVGFLKLQAMCIQIDKLTKPNKAGEFKCAPLIT